MPISFKRTRKGGRVGLRVTRNSVPTYDVDKADLEQRQDRGLKTWMKKIHPLGLIHRYLLGRETRSGKEKLGLRITRGEKVGLRVTRGDKLGIRITKKDKNTMYDFCRLFNCF